VQTQIKDFYAYFEDELSQVDNDKEIVNERVNVIGWQAAMLLGFIRPRPQQQRVDNDDKHHESSEPLRANDSVSDVSVHSRAPVFWRLLMVTAMAVAVALLFRLLFSH